MGRCYDDDEKSEVQVSPELGEKFNFFAKTFVGCNHFENLTPEGALVESFVIGKNRKAFNSRTGRMRNL